MGVRDRCVDYFEVFNVYRIPPASHAHGLRSLRSVTAVPRDRVPRMLFLCFSTLLAVLTAERHTDIAR
jgi:hypothetical protein